MPRCSMILMICRILVVVKTASPVLRRYRAGMGTPQALWRDMHHSLLFATKLVSRVFPVAGRKSTASRDSSAPFLILLTSANHCAVARIKTGFFVLQSYGYLCVYFSWASRSPEESNICKTLS